MYRMQSVKVGTLVSGEIDCADLKALLLAHKDKPVIINLNIGLTLTPLTSLSTHILCMLLFCAQCIQTLGKL